MQNGYALARRPSAAEITLQVIFSVDKFEEGDAFLKTKRHRRKTGRKF